MQRVLDLDLDFFVRPSVHHVPESNPRPSDQAHRVWPEAAVKAFLCRLGVHRPLPGCAMLHHRDALPAWGRALSCGLLRAPFHVVHVDAHEDLGFGDPLWIRLQEEVLTAPLPARRLEQIQPLVHSGNYLLLAASLGWIGRLTLVLPSPLAAAPLARLRNLNVHPLHFAGGDEASGLLQLGSAPGLSAVEQAARCRTLVRTVLDPPIPLQVCEPGQVQPAAYDFFTLAASPAFCPPAADRLWPLLSAWVSDSDPEAW